MEQKKIVLTHFPFTDLSSTKRRPALVLSPTDTSANDVIVAFISSVVPTALESTEYLLDNRHSDFRLSGLTRNSVIKTDKLATLDKAIFTGEIGELSDSTFQDIQSKLKIALGL